MGLRTEAACLADVQRAHRFNAETFEVFRINDDGSARRNAAQDEQTLDGCLANVAMLYERGAKIMVRCTDQLSGTVTLRFYAIREGKPTWMRIGHETRRVAKRSAEHLFDLKPAGLEL